MASQEEIVFTVSDNIDGRPISPAEVPLGLLKEFATQVGGFVAGSNKDVIQKDLVISLVDGSLGIKILHVALAASMWADVMAVRQGASLDSIDSRRAELLQKWHDDAVKHPGRTIRIYDSAAFDLRVPLLTINKDTHFREEKETWLRVQKHVLVQIVDMGGKSEPNIHVVLPSGESLKISANARQIAGETENRVYHRALLSIEVDENLKSGKLRDARLLQFEDYAPRFDEQEFEELTDRGRRAWSEIKDSVDWLNKQRGS